MIFKKSSPGLKTNILLLTDCLADLAGGAEKQIFELAKGLDKNKYNVFIVSLDCWGQAPRELIESTGSQLDIFRVVRIYGLSGLFQGFRFFRYLKKNNIKIMMTYHFSSDIWGTFWGHLAGVPTIISNRRDMGFWRNKWHIKAYRVVNRWVSKMVVVSQSIKDMVIRIEGVAAHQIEIIYNGVSLPYDLKGSNPLLKIHEKIILHVANLKPIKGHTYLIRAFAGVVKIHPLAKLYLIGKDELNGQIQELVSSLHLEENVTFFGKRDDVLKWLAMADICVLPSLSEGMSNSILEYMSAAKPVIATRVGGNPELIRDGYNGLLVDKENESQLQEAMLTLLQDKEKCRSMGKNGLFRVKQEFSMDAMISHYDQFLMSFSQHQRRKVLHLVSSGGLFGAERVILNLSSRCQRIESFIGAILNHHSPHLEITEEAQSQQIPNVFFESRGQFDLRTIAEIRRFMVTHHIDILHTHNYKADLLGFWATRLSGKKWVATNHVWHSTDKKLKFYETLDALVLKYAHQVVSVSNEIRDDLLQKGFNVERLQVIDNGIPIENFNRGSAREKTRADFNFKPNQCVIVIVGRLAEEKGHDIFLQAAALVVQKVKNVKFLIVGDGPLLEVLKLRVKELSLSDDVIFTGIRKDMPEIYAACDILVNSSYIEGLPMTILEAMASHLTVIATKVGGVGKVIRNQENGILLEAGNLQALTHAILELVLDEQKRHRMAKIAYDDVCHRFSDERMADQYQDIYLGL